MGTILLLHSKRWSLWGHNLFPCLCGGASSVVWLSAATWEQAVMNDSLHIFKMCSSLVIKASTFIYRLFGDHMFTAVTSPVCHCTCSTCLPPPSSPASIVAKVLRFLSEPVPGLLLVLSALHAVLPALCIDTLW